MPTKSDKTSVRESTNIVYPFLERTFIPHNIIKTEKPKKAKVVKPVENQRVADRIKLSTKRASKIRDEEANKYTIPYIKDKEIRLTTGRYNTGKISTNVLDSIYDSAIRVGLDPKIALGLAGRESTLGIGRGFKRGKSISGTDLMSNWQQITPYLIPNDVTYGFNSVYEKYNDNTPMTKEEADKMIKFFDENDKSVASFRRMKEHPIDNALKFYMAGKYNPGDKKHTQMVEGDARILMSDPAVQKWYQEKTKEQMKCGGRKKAQLGLDIREGGIAIPINKNMYYMQGRSHDEGGIGIGPNNKNGLEVEGGEVVKVDDNSIKVFSSVPLLRGVSPAQLVMGGANPNKVFKAQEDFKDRNNINDDGTTYQIGGEKNNKYPLRALTEDESRPLGGYPTISGVRTYKYLRGLVKGTKAINKGTNLFRAGRYKLKGTVNSAIKSGKLNPQLGQAIKSAYNKFIGSTGQELPKTINLIFEDNKTEKKAGGIYIKPSKRGTFTAAAKKHGMGVQEFASKVLANKENYSPVMVKKANFARNASRWKKEYGGRTKAPFGLESPIEGGYYPESSEPQTIKWLSDWLNNRRTQLYENTASSPSHSFYYSKPFDDIRGLFKGISGNRLQTNRVFYSLINNAAEATHKIGNTVSSISSGQYDKKVNEITYPNSNIDMGTSIHERTHAMKNKPQTFKIKSILGDRYNQPFGQPDSNSRTYPLVQYMNQYLSDPEEIYSRMMEYRYNSNLKPSDKVDVNQLNNNRKLLKFLNLNYISDDDLINLFNNVANSNNSNKAKAKYGGNMIYEINGNIKNSLMSLRPKAELGKEKKINSTTKIGADGLIYTWGPDGEWYTDGTRYEDSKYYMREKSVLTGSKRSDGSVVRPKQKTQSLDEFVVTAPRINRQEVVKPNVSVETNTQTTSNTSPQFYAEKRMPMFGEKSVAEKMGMARSGWSYGSTPTISGVNENVLAWDYPAINYRKINRKQREEISKISNSQAVKQEVPTNEKPYSANIPSLYDIASQIYSKYIAPKVADGTINLNAVPEKTKMPETETSENKDERLIGQYKKLTTEDWIGLGSNVIGSLANYFINKNTINKMPMPSRPVSTPAAKLKTRFNINAPLSELREAEQLQRNIISRNTQSSNVSRAAQQRAINEAQRGRNQLYTQKENVETQLINQDRLNRQSITARNIAAYNDWMNRLTSAKINQSQLRSANVTNLISGLTGGVTDILGRIENRRATNNALRAYAAANPNVDARIIGGFDYYRDAQGRKYDKNGRLIG